MLDRLFRRRGLSVPAPDSSPADPVRVAHGLRTGLPQGAYTADDRALDFRAVLSETAAGRRVFAQILERCRVCARSHVSGDALETARREGMRDVGLWLLDLLDAVPPARAPTAEQEPDTAPGARG